MGCLNLKEVIVFLDDLIVFADTLEEHERRLMQILHRLKDFGLIPREVHFFLKKVSQTSRPCCLRKQGRD